MKRITVCIFIFKLVSIFILAEVGHSNSDFNQINSIVKGKNFLNFDNSLVHLPEGSKIIFFWATWCSICKSIMPQWISQQKSMSSKFKVIFVNTDKDTKIWKLDESMFIPKEVNFHVSEETRKKFLISPRLPLVYIIGVDGLVQSSYHVWNSQTSDLLFRRLKWELRGQL